MQSSQSPNPARAFARAMITFLARSLVQTLALTRHGALVAARSMQTHRAFPPLTKAGFVLVGSTFIGLGVALFMHGALGLAPYDVFVSALVDRIGLSHGQTAWLVAGVLFGIAAVLGRPPSRYGLLFVVANGLAIDAWAALLVDPQSLVTRLVFVFGGIAAVATGVAVVAHSGSTGGPFELLSLAASDRGLDQTVTRSLLEVAIVGAGLLLGGNAGPATVAFAVMIGPAISMLIQALADREVGREVRLTGVSSE